MSKRIRMHIGSHKTGSTSIQRFLADHHTRLSEMGYAVYGRERGRFHHKELYLASMRYERETFAKLRSSRVIDAEFTERIARSVKRFIASTPEPDIVMTSEGLSLLRYPDEIARLKHILDADRHDVSIILILRDKADYLRSYRSQLLKDPARTPSSDPNSALYVEDDTWLTDFDALRRLYETGFPGKMRVIDYDEEMRMRGNSLHAYLSALGVDHAFDDLDNYFFNVTTPDADKDV